MPITLAFYKGRRSDNSETSLFDMLVCLWTRSRYSHVEMVDPDDGSAWSSSPRDGGVRQTWINWSSGHWEFVTVPGDAHAARDRIKACVGMGYDWFGLLFFVVPWNVHERHKMFCSEAVAYGLEIDLPWTFSPASLMAWVLASFPQVVRPTPGPL